jgi:signal peptidase II
MTDEADSRADAPEAANEEAAPEADGEGPSSEADKPAAVAKPVPEAEAPKPDYVFLAVVSIVSLVADLGTKAWAKARLDDPTSVVPKRIELIDGLLGFVFAKNRGGAWGLLQDEHESLRRPFFLLISVAAVVFIVSLYRKLVPGQVALKWGLPLVLGGAIGNLVDRVRYGYVVDFIDAYVRSGGREHHWPTFNVADIAIVVGVGLMAVDMFTSKKREKALAS